jgi:hypothetical protein
MEEIVGEQIFGKQLADSRQELILFAEAVKANKIAKAEEANKITKAEEANKIAKAEETNKYRLFFKAAVGSRYNWLLHIASYIESSRIMFANIINTETSYYTDGPQPLIERKFIVVFLDFYQSTQTAIKGAVEVNAKKNGERNINHNNTFYCSTISYEEAKAFYMFRLKGRINYSGQHNDTYPDIIAAALEDYIAKNDPDIILDKLPFLVYR